MPRDIPVGNGSLLITFDKNYNLRDLYWPHVGEKNHTNGEVSHTGVWADGQFFWLDDDSWERSMSYEHETLVTEVTCVNQKLQLSLTFHDVVDFNRPIFIRKIEVKNNANFPRDVRLFFHYDWHIGENADANTAYFYPNLQAVIAYKEIYYFLTNGQAGGITGVSSWATGIKEFNGAQGTWKDAEDGVLGQNSISQGSVDSTIALNLPHIAPGGTETGYHWLVAGNRFQEVRDWDKTITRDGPEFFIQRTRNYWRTWVNKQQQDFADLDDEIIDLYKRSLLVMRTQIDSDGAIIAGNDTDVFQFSRDTYSYMWPRDGSLVANALSHAGYPEITQSFFRFCAKVITDEGFLLHKYTPSGTLGSSWHPWADVNGQAQLPIQEDETALVVYSLWQHYQLFRDIEFIKPLYRPLIKDTANFMMSYREPFTKLPAPSYDLWEERRGILSYTVAAVYSGLEAAANFAELFGEVDYAKKYHNAAGEIKDATMKYLWDENEGHFLRMINVNKDTTIEKDTMIDSSLCALFQFGMFSADTPEIQRTMEAIESKLWCKTEVGGLARYINDYYHQISKDIDNVPGNPWFICTLWLAQYRIAKATNIDELHEALPLLDWVKNRCLKSGVLAEQVNPYTNEPLSVSPLTWSHAEFVATIRWYCGKQRRFEIENLNKKVEADQKTIEAAVDEHRARN